MRRFSAEARMAGALAAAGERGFRRPGASVKFV
jgi:hypothetical protein